MSMKVYNAFRLKPSVDLWPFLWQLHTVARTNTKEALKAHYVELVRKMDDETEEYRAERAKDPGRPEHSFRLGLAHNLVTNGFRENVTKLQRDTYSLEVAVALYPHKGRYYLRTFCESSSVVGGVLDFVEHLPELEDYHYQNQTDRPDDVTARDWAHRRRTWDAIVESNNGIGNHVTLEVLGWSSFYLVDPWLDLAKEWRETPPQLPSREEVWVEELKALRTLRNDKITFEPGALKGTNFSVLRQEDGVWVATLKKRRPRRFPTLNRAADYVWFEHQPESTKEFVRRMLKETKEQRRAQKSAKRG